MIRPPYLVLILALLTACGEKPREISQHPVSLPKDTFKISVKTKIDSVVSVPVKISGLETQLCSLGLVNIHSLDSTIRVNLKYSTADNFIGIDVYGEFNQCYLQPDVAEKLVMAEKFLREKYPFYRLIVFDAVRPLSIQQKMWDTLVLPPGEKIKYLSNPKNFSLHNYGAAVDLSIIDENGIQLDMGTPFDFFGEKAHPVKEQELLAAGELTGREIANREILRDVMRKAGFFGIQTEWWHFNSCTREVAATKYQIVQ
ncbi:MAG TPA: M15 family metallopeptidase [Bacteroidia bacterium]|nr:M15 family metallopeptidase [Bacteroidia bacterium]